MDIPKDLKNEIFDYCRENDITNIDNFLLRLLKQGFTIEKFGSTPVTKIKEKIVEKIVEVPVEKNVYLTDDAEISILTEKINNLEVRLNEEINKNNELLETINLLKQQRKNIYGE
jgi:hypothetical protein